MSGQWIMEGGIPVGPAVAMLRPGNVDLPEKIWCGGYRFSVCPDGVLWTGSEAAAHLPDLRPTFGYGPVASEVKG